MTDTEQAAQPEASWVPSIPFSFRFEDESGRVFVVHGIAALRFESTGVVAVHNGAPRARSKVRIFDVRLGRLTPDGDIVLWQDRRDLYPDGSAEERAIARAAFADVERTVVAMARRGA